MFAKGCLNRIKIFFFLYLSICLYIYLSVYMSVYVCLLSVYTKISPSSRPTLALLASNSCPARTKQLLGSYPNVVLSISSFSLVRIAMSFCLAQVLICFLVICFGVTPIMTNKIVNNQIRYLFNFWQFLFTSQFRF